MTMYNDLLKMTDEFLQLDFSQTPNFKAICALRNELITVYGQIDFVNQFVARMEIDVSAATQEQAEALGKKWAALCVKFIDVFRKEGFDLDSIALMASQMNLRFTENG